MNDLIQWIYQDDNGGSGDGGGVLCELLNTWSRFSILSVIISNGMLLIVLKQSKKSV